MGQNSLSNVILADNKKVLVSDGVLYVPEVMGLNSSPDMGTRFIVKTPGVYLPRYCGIICGEEKGKLITQFAGYRGGHHGGLNGKDTNYAIMGYEDILLATCKTCPLKGVCKWIGMEYHSMKYCM